MEQRGPPLTLPAVPTQDLFWILVLSRSVGSDSLRPHGLQPSRLLYPWGFSKREYSSGLPCPPPGDLPNPGTKPRSPALQVDSLPSEPSGKPRNTGVGSLTLPQGIFPTQESNWALLHCRRILYQLSYQGSPLNSWMEVNWAERGMEWRRGLRARSSGSPQEGTTNLWARRRERAAPALGTWKLCRGFVTLVYCPGRGCFRPSPAHLTSVPGARGPLWAPRWRRTWGGEPGSPRHSRVLCLPIMLCNSSPQPAQPSCKAE